MCERLIGIFACTATAPSRNDTSSSSSSSSPALRLLEPLKDCIAIDGESITLQCRVTSSSSCRSSSRSDPGLTVTWHQGAREIASSDEFKQAVNGDKVSMTIAQIFPDDEGEYSCRIKHDASQSDITSQCYLLVKGEDPSQKKKTKNILCCMKFAFGHTCKQQLEFA